MKIYPRCRNPAGPSGNRAVWDASQEGGLRCLRRFTVDCTADCEGSGWIKVRDRLPQRSPAMRRRCLDFLLAYAAAPNPPALCLYTPGNSNRLRNASWLARHVLQLFRTLWLKSRSPRRIRPAAAGAPLHRQSEGKEGPKWRQLERRHRRTPSLR